MSIIDIGTKRSPDAGSTEAGDGFTAAPGRMPPSARPRTVRIDRAELIREGFLPPVNAERQFRDQFRHVKRPLLGGALGRGMEPLPDGRLIMLTSSLPNEGKTFVSINIAFSLAIERDIDVILVDADVAKRHVSTIFGIDTEPGLLDAVRDENLDLDSVILPTTVANLWLLGAGRPSETATELLSSHRMKSIAGKIGIGLARTRIVIFDSPPVLLTSESRALAQHVGQIVMVVRAGATPKQAVLDAINCLAGDRPIYMLLNQSELQNERGYYYYGAGYGQYGSEAPAESHPAGKGEAQ